MQAYIEQIIQARRLQRIKRDYKITYSQRFKNINIRMWQCM